MGHRGSSASRCLWLFCFDNLAHWLWFVPLCTLCTLNTFPPTHEPPSPSLGCICSSETIWYRHNSRTNVGNVETAIPESASQVLHWLSTRPGSGLYRSKGAKMLSSRAPEVTCPVVKDLLFLHLGNCQRSLQAFHSAGGIQNKAGANLAHGQKDFRPNDSPLEDSDKAFQRTWFAREFSSWDLFNFQGLLRFF